MTLIEVNPGSKTAPQDLSCEAVDFHCYDTTFHECKTVPITARKNVFVMVQVGEGLCIKPGRFSIKIPYREFYGMTFTDLHRHDGVAAVAVIY